MLIIAKGRPIEIRCYATDTDGSQIIAQAEEVKAFLAGTAVIAGADYITVEEDSHGDTYFRLRFVKYYTLRRLNPCAYALRLQIASRKMRVKDIFAIDTYKTNDNTGLQPGDTCVIRLTLTEAATGQITWAEDITVPGTLEAIRVNGSNYFMDDRVITLPDYPSSLSQLQGDAGHKTVSQSQIEAWNAALEKIPAGASAQNKLVTNTEMDAAIDEASPVYRGMNITATTLEELMAWASLLTHDLNDFILWRQTDESGNISYTKFRYDGENWVEEFTINGNSFTAAQWDAINSGITSASLAEIQASIAYLLVAISEAATIEQLATKLDNTPKGSHSLPVYIKENPETGYGEAEVIDSLDLPGRIHSGTDIEADRGVAAKGIADLSLNGGAGATGTVKGVKIGDEQPIEPDEQGIVELPAYPDEPDVIVYGRLNPTEDESTSKVATAKSVAVLKDNMGLENLDEFDATATYHRGETCKVTDSAGFCRGYRFTEDKEPGDWDSTAVERLNYVTLARPLNIQSAAMNTILD